MPHNFSTKALQEKSFLKNLEGANMPPPVGIGLSVTPELVLLPIKQALFRGSKFKVHPIRMKNGMQYHLWVLNIKIMFSSHEKALIPLSTQPPPRTPQGVSCKKIIVVQF